jgi:hypothetical protein
LQTSADLAKETAEATAELQNNCKSFENGKRLRHQYIKENKEAKAFVDCSEH